MKFSRYIKSVIASAMILPAIFAVGCGYSSSQNELIGQVKKVQKQTPILCGNYTVADVSLGAMQNGVGSMSNQDVWVVVEDKDFAAFQQAVETGRLVKVKYDVKRLVFCTGNEKGVINHFATSIELMPSPSASPVGSPSPNSMSAR